MGLWDDTCATRQHAAWGFPRGNRAFPPCLISEGDPGGKSCVFSWGYPDFTGILWGFSIGIPWEYHVFFDQWP